MGTRAPRDPQTSPSDEPHVPRPKNDTEITGSFVCTFVGCHHLRREKNGHVYIRSVANNEKESFPLFATTGVSVSSSQPSPDDKPAASFNSSNTYMLDDEGDEHFSIGRLRRRDDNDDDKGDEDPKVGRGWWECSDVFMCRHYHLHESGKVYVRSIDVRSVQPATRFYVTRNSTRIIYPRANDSAEDYHALTRRDDDEEEEEKDPKVGHGWWSCSDFWMCHHVHLHKSGDVYVRSVDMQHIVPEVHFNATDSWKLLRRSARSSANASDLIPAQKSHNEDNENYWSCTNASLCHHYHKHENGKVHVRSILVTDANSPVSDPVLTRRRMDAARWKNFNETLASPAFQMWLKNEYLAAPDGAHDQVAYGEDFVKESYKEGKILPHSVWRFEEHSPVDDVWHIDFQPYFLSGAVPIINSKRDLTSKLEERHHHYDPTMGSHHEKDKDDGHWDYYASMEHEKRITEEEREARRAWEKHWMDKNVDENWNDWENINCPYCGRLNKRHDDDEDKEEDGEPRTRDKLKNIAEHFLEAIFRRDEVSTSNATSLIPRSANQPSLHEHEDGTSGKLSDLVGGIILSIFRPLINSSFFQQSVNVNSSAQSMQGKREVATAEDHPFSLRQELSNIFGDTLRMITRRDVRHASSHNDESIQIRSARPDEDDFDASSEFSDLAKDYAKDFWLTGRYYDKRQLMVPFLNSSTNTLTSRSSGLGDLVQQNSRHNGSAHNSTGATHGQSHVVVGPLAVLNHTRYADSIHFSNVLKQVLRVQRELQRNLLTMTEFSEIAADISLQGKVKETHLNNDRSSKASGYNAFLEQLRAAQSRLHITIAIFNESVHHHSFNLTSFNVTRYSNVTANTSAPLFQTGHFKVPRNTEQDGKDDTAPDPKPPAPPSSGRHYPLHPWEAPEYRPPIRVGPDGPPPEDGMEQSPHFFGALKPVKFDTFNGRDFRRPSQKELHQLRKWLVEHPNANLSRIDVPLTSIKSKRGELEDWYLAKRGESDDWFLPTGEAPWLQHGLKGIFYVPKSCDFFHTDFVISKPSGFQRYRRHVGRRWQQWHGLQLGHASVRKQVEGRRRRNAVGESTVETAIPSEVSQSKTEAASQLFQV